MTRPRVLFVAPVEPWCRENGSSLITADLLDRLAAYDEIELLTIFVRRPPPGYQRIVPPDLRGELLDIPGLPRWFSVFTAALRWSSPLRHRFDNGRVARRIGRVLAERAFRPDLVHVEHLPLVDIGLKLSQRYSCGLAYRAHNIESRLWARRLGLPGPLSAPVVAHMERQEADAIRSVDLALFISEPDLQWARTRAPKAQTELLPCSLDLERYDSVVAPPPVFRDQICFVGGLDWAPNEDGLRWFVLNVLPEIVRRAPQAGLTVLARGAEQRPWLQASPNVRVLPAEAQAAELFASSRVSIAPLFQAGGVRIKIPESLSLGCPVVATEIGAEGHELPGLTTADEPNEFAEACLRHLGKSAQPDMRESLRAGVEARYGAATVARRLVGLWRNALPSSGHGELPSSTRAALGSRPQ